VASDVRSALARATHEVVAESIPPLDKWLFVRAAFAPLVTGAVPLTVSTNALPGHNLPFSIAKEILKHDPLIEDVFETGRDYRFRGVGTGETLALVAKLDLALTDGVASERARESTPS